MTLRYLLDTNVISEPLRPAPDQAVVDHLREHQTEIAIASVVWHELWYGCYRLPASTKRSVIEAYLNNVVARAIPMLPYDQQAAQWHAEGAGAAGADRSYAAVCRWPDCCRRGHQWPVPGDVQS